MQHMVRAAWWVLAVIALAFSIWFAVTRTMADVDLGCAKVAEGGAAFECGDRITDVLGIWPPVWLGISLVAPSAVAGRVWASGAATVALIVAGIVGLANWTGFWGTLLVALPLAALGAFVTFIQIARKRRPERHPERRRGQVRG